MSRKRPAPPAPVARDVAELWPTLDHLVRHVLPQRLAALGFIAIATRFRLIPELTGPSSARGIPGYAREARLEIFAHAAAAAARVTELEDDSERLRARAAAHSPSYQDASVSIGLVEVAAQWSGSVDEYRAGLTQAEHVEIAYRQIIDARRLLTK